MKTTTKQTHLYSNTDLRKLLIPIIIEQLLSSLMGTVDTMMVSNVGSAAISAVSLVDSINILVIQALSALAAGGAILCSQYIGSEKRDGAIRSAQQVLFVMAVLSVALSAGCLIFRVPLLRVIFGAVEADVMKNSQVYFLFTLLSFPFIGLYDAGASILRAQNNSRSPMVISVISNFMNIGGNAILIFGFHMGVEGAAISTLISRIFCAVVVLWKLRDESKPIFVKQYLSIRPDFGLIKKILFIGIPSGIENSMFQFGKLAIQSTVSTLGTVAIAAQAMCWLSEMVIVASCLLVFVLTKPITMIGGMEAESAKLCMQMMIFITIVKPLCWVMAFVPGYGMRAAGDVKFSMITSCCTMWLCRVSLCIYLCRIWGFGPIAVWIGMAADWSLRSILFTIRFKSGKWLNHHLIEEKK